MLDNENKFCDAKYNVTTKNPIKDVLVANYKENSNDENWNNLLNAYWYGIIEYCYKILGDTTMAHDSAVETFERARTYFYQYDDNKAKFSTWLWTICRNVCYAASNENKKASRYTFSIDVNDIYDGTMCSTSNVVEEDDVYDKAFCNERNEVIKGLYDVSVNEIHKIDGKEGVILEMKLLQNMKIVEISNKLDINENTVKSLLYKGKRKLISNIKKQYGDLYDDYIIYD